MRSCLLYLCCFLIRYKGQEGFAPAAYLQRYHGAVINTEVTTGAQVVSTVKDAIASNGHESAGWKPVDSARITTPKSSTLKSPEPTSPKTTESANWKTLDTQRVTSPKSPRLTTKPVFEATKKPSDKVRSPTPKSSEEESVTSPTPVSPKPSVQKFAPSWHSMQHHYIDKERELARCICSSSQLHLLFYPTAIYAPTPRISPAVSVVFNYA